MRSRPKCPTETAERTISGSLFDGHDGWATVATTMPDVPARFGTMPPYLAAERNGRASFAQGLLPPSAWSTSSLELFSPGMRSGLFFPMTAPMVATEGDGKLRPNAC